MTACTLVFEQFNKVQSWILQNAEDIEQVICFVFKVFFFFLLANIHQLSSLLDNERRKSHLSLERHFIQMQEMLCTEMKRMSHEINELKLKCCQQNFPAIPASTYPQTASSSFQQSKYVLKVLYLHWILFVWWNVTVKFNYRNIFQCLIW